VDVNVRRVLERSDLEFDHECGPALMGLGAQVCIARVPRCGVCPLAEECPSRGRRFEAERKQAPYEGSFRQRRATTLRLVSGQPRRGAELDDEAVAALAEDGLVEVENDVVRLPTTRGS
jgi:A/G-specific adenine glycosylase